ncbi:MAG: TraB/GumN family protein [Helicobacteraceae bacterium]|jgi:uncharacterized protein YbaP (TraB family)|nr:TraB/GumN family protein [Helicobacteraceae bacterium]
MKDQTRAPQGLKAIVGLTRLVTFFAAMLLPLSDGALAKTNAETTARYPFYAAEKEGETIYILGAMHLGRQGTALNDEIVAALRKSSKLILEISPSELKKAQTPQFECKEPYLSDQIGDRSFAQIAEKYPRSSLIIDDLECASAWYVGVALGELDYMREGFLPRYGTESLLQKSAKAGVTIEGLESFDEQLNAMASMSAKTQREMLKSYLDSDRERLKRDITDLYKLFLDGDADRLLGWYLASNAAQEMPPEAVNEFNEKLIYERNLRFVERLQKLIDPKKPVFVSVGALHLGGEKGVLQLLRKKGYTIKRL